MKRASHAAIAHACLLLAGCGAPELTREEAERQLAAHADEQHLYLTSVEDICRTDGTVYMALAYWSRSPYSTAAPPAPGAERGDAAGVALARGLEAAGLTGPSRYASEPSSRGSSNNRRWLSAPIRPPLELARLRVGDRARCRFRVGTLGPVQVTGITRRSDGESLATFTREWSIDRARIDGLGAAARRFYCTGDGPTRRTECESGAAVRGEARFRLFDDGWRIDD